MTHAFSKIQNVSSAGVSGLRVATLAIGLGFAAIGVAHAEEAAGEAPVEQQHWSFGGVRGHFDRAQLQRGFQVYKEICANCHSINQLSFRNLGEKGGPEFPEDQVKGLAATYKVNDGPNDKGKMFKRPGIPSDRIPGPFNNDAEARSANNGALPPDFSLLAKARGIEVERPFYMVPVAMLKDIFLSGGYQEGGPDYIYNLLNGYKADAPAFHVMNGHMVMMSDAEAASGGAGMMRCASLGEAEPDKPETCNKLGSGMYYNMHFSGHQIAMPPPLSDGAVTYKDGTANTVENYARDVAAFMAWAADPKLEERKRLGIMSVLYLLATSLLLYFAKKRVWAGEAH